ncbi:MAG: cytochrome c peroxidase, partial [Bacteroidota bacterium]
SCASCHKQEQAFSDDRRQSIGHTGQFTRRNSMSLSNLRWHRRFFWDSRTVNITNQIPQPIQDPLEMGMSMEDLEEKLQTIEYYPGLFAKAYGDSSITAERIINALSQFNVSLYSYHSKYDKGLEVEFANFSEAEKRGKDLFFSNRTRCNQCHMTALFYNPTAVNGGLETLNDDGLAETTGDSDDLGVFKVPTLRNIEVTGPYMHDGRFETLEEVIRFYNEEIVQMPNLDDRLTMNYETGGTPIQMNLTEEEISDLVAFLKTLTDHDFLTEPKYSNPFR